MIIILMITTIHSCFHSFYHIIPFYHKLAVYKCFEDAVVADDDDYDYVLSDIVVEQSIIFHGICSNN